MLTYVNIWDGLKLVENELTARKIAKSGFLKKTSVNKIRIKEMKMLEIKN
jgi:hypothetical protein